MARQVTNKSFRDMFTFANKNVAKWFPGHMHSGWLAMQRNLRKVDCVVEVHDARIPVSGRNPNFQKMLGAVKPHLLVLNKVDLADLSRKDEVESLLKREGVTEVLYTNCRAQSDKGLKNVVSSVVELIRNSPRFNREEAEEYCAMIMGIPNVGKSSLINMLRHKYLKKGKATRVGAQPGITRSVQERIKICEKPLIYLLDTPGILAPNAKSIETGLRLALCATIKDAQIGVDILADYLLYWLNKHRNFDYVDYLQLDEPSDDIREVLLKTAVNLNRIIVVRTPDGSREERYDLHGAAEHFVRAFRQGVFGKVMLDDDLLKT